MATTSHAQAVKSLNKSSGGRRFVFKTFSQRVEEIEIDVYRSLDKIKSEPSAGSSFFHDCLVEWRELNTAEDFISFYVEMMPLVQTLPLVLLHKDLIISGLLSRLQMKARLSLEPILRLIAALSRDLLEDFVFFLPRIADSFMSLLESGADREPEIIEQIFVSWSYILMYLQKYLVQEIVQMLKVTVKLRYYPKGYVQEFMAVATSFLLRNAPKEQLIKGIRKIMLEVVKKPLLVRKSGVSALLYHIMRGTSSRFHSRAKRVLQLLIEKPMFTVGDKFDQGANTVAEVVITTFERLCEELELEELNLMWNCLYQKIVEAVTNENLLHLSCLLSLLISIVKISNGRKVSDYQPMLEFVESLVQKFVLPSGMAKEESHLQEIIDKVLQLMPCILDGLSNFNDVSSISQCSTQWSPVFTSRNSSCLTFIGELLEKDICVLHIFGANILSAMNNLIETSQEEVICLLLSFCERLQKEPQSSGFLDGISEEKISKICGFLQQNVDHWVGCVNDIVLSNAPCIPMCQSKLALLWGIICCYPNMMGIQANPSSLMDLIDGFDRLLVIEDDRFAGVPKRTWQSLVAAVISAYCRYRGESGLEETSRVLELAKTHKSSSQVLSAVADYLDYVNGPTQDADINCATYYPEFGANNVVDALRTFADNLCNPDKIIRLSTLRILCHYEPIVCELAAEEQPPAKKLKTEVPQDGHGSDVLQLLLLIEDTPLSISTSRKVVLLISKIQMSLSAGKINEAYVPAVLSGIIGIFLNRFSYLWNPASECLAVLISKHLTLAWDKFIHYFEECQSAFLNSDDKLGKIDVTSNNSSELVERFNSVVNSVFDCTPYVSVLSALLHSLQKIPAVAESRSRQIIPMFLKFLGYSNDDLLSVGSFNSHACKGKEWKGVLKEWLNLLKLMRNSKAFFRSQFVKNVLWIRLMDENDAEIQMKVLDCLLTWKDDFLLPYEQHLRNLICSKNLREELTTWSLSRESNLIEESHRPNLVPLVILLLMPKVRKLKTLASRKQASVHHRKAVLRFIAQLDVNEIPLFFVFLVKPLHATSKGDGTTNLFWTVPESSMEELQLSHILQCFTTENIITLSWKKRYGFLHVVEEILGVFDELHVKPFLNLLMGCVVRVLESCTSSLDAAKCGGTATITNSSVGLKFDEKQIATSDHCLTSTAMKQLKDLRSLCLKVISLVLNKYDDHDFSGEFWDIFFTSVEPLIDNFKQEGSSSVKPSSLFSCFLAMSSSHHLVSLLHRKKSLVPDIFSILTLSTASEAIIFCVLKFIENLLNLDEQLDDENNAVTFILVPNLKELISSLHYLFQSSNTTKRKVSKYPLETHVRIFKLLSKYINQQTLARKFVDVLLPILSTRFIDSDVRVECLQVIRDVMPILGNESTKKILNAVSPLLIYAEMGMRFSICGLLDALAKIDPSVLSVAKLIGELNAPSAMEIDEVDYDIVLNAYGKIGISFFSTVEEDQVLLVLSHCVHDMSSKELMLRNSAYGALLSFVEFSILVLDEETKTSCGMNESWTRACMQRIIKKFFLKHIGNAMKAEISVMKEWIELLRDMALKVPEVADLGSLKALCSEDAEQDFFHNIIHLQRYRRAKALSRFRNVISKNHMSEGILNKVFLPLFFNILFDVQDRKGEHIKTACVETISLISGCLEWKSYYALLVRCFQEMNMNPDRHKILLRLICSILDQFHFSKICSEQETKSSVDNIPSVETTISSPRPILCIPDTDSSAMFNKGGDVVTATDIQACLSKIVLPKIQKLLDSNSDKVNVNISVAAVKVLKLLPEDRMESQLPSIIHRIANHLKSRLQSIRDEARLALAACLKELGLEYLQFVVGILRATLKRGFELHVLGYSLNFILSKFLSSPISGKLDYCLDDLLSVVENDILGDVAEEKEVEKISSKMKETKKRKSFDTLKLVAQNITFKTHALKLLSPVTSHMLKHLTPKVKAKLESMLNHMAAGIECNPSVDQTDLFIFIYGLIEDGISEENSQGKNSSDVNATHGVNRTVSSNRVVGTKSACSHLITVFSLGLFNNRIKSMKLDKNNDQLLSMLDPFVKLLGDCLSTKYEDILSASLRCLTPLIRLPLPSLACHADKIKMTLLDIAQSSVNANSPLMQSCLKLLTVLLRSTKITLSTDQLHLLIQFPLFVDLERNPSFIALSLLKAIVNRKLVVHEIYDVAIRVAELMVRSQMESIRKKCSHILLQFLLDYHLSATYLQQHLDFLLKNLSYEYSSGREAVLEMLHAILIKFPKSFLDKHAQTLFVHLVQCLANDVDIKVRSMTAAVIKLLIGRISTHLLDSIFDFSVSWYMDEKRRLQSLGAQAMGLLVEAMTKSFQKNVNIILPVSSSILQTAVNVVADQQLDVSAEVVPFWKEAYYSLVLLEKILHHFHDLVFEKDLEDIWAAICELLLHPHAWLRKISSRLVAFYFNTAMKAGREDQEMLQSLFLMRPSILFMIAASLCSQLKTQINDDAVANLVTENLVFAIHSVHSLMGRTEYSDPCKFWSSLEKHEQGQFLKAFQLLDSRKEKGMFLHAISGVLDQTDRKQFEDLRYLLVSSLLKVIGKIALQMDAIQMKIVFNCFGRISSQINQDDCQHYAFDMLLPLCKVCEEHAGKIIPDDLKQLAQEVSNSIRNTLGIHTFVRVWSEIKNMLKVKRDKRKQEEKRMAVVNPMRNAKRKLRAAAKHRAHKKRKVMTMKMARWMH